MNMSSFIGTTILWTLALYGLWELIKSIFYICTYTNCKADGIYLIIAAKNQENKIEGFLRTILFRILYGKEENIKEIIVTDLDSEDNTKWIIEKLAKEHDVIKTCDWKDCKELMDTIGECGKK